MEVLIVSKTHMSNSACVGGFVLSDNTYVRLLNPGSRNQAPDTGFEIGQVWDLDFIVKNPLIPPHIEDVIVRQKEFVKVVENLAAIIKNRKLINWEGSIENVFDGLLQWTGAGSGYIDPNGALPAHSVGFWTSDMDLIRHNYMGTRYNYPDNKVYRSLKFVGYQEPVETIPAGTIIRLSLTRSFTGNETNGYWLQLSGWY